MTAINTGIKWLYSIPKISANKKKIKDIKFADKHNHLTNLSSLLALQYEILRKPTKTLINPVAIYNPVLILISSKIIEVLEIWIMPITMTKYEVILYNVFISNTYKYIIRYNLLNQVKSKQILQVSQYIFD